MEVETSADVAVVVVEEQELLVQRLERDGAQHQEMGQHLEVHGGVHPDRPSHSSLETP